MTHIPSFGFAKNPVSCEFLFRQNVSRVNSDVDVKVGDVIQPYRIILFKLFNVSNSLNFSVSMVELLK